MHGSSIQDWTARSQTLAKISSFVALLLGLVLGPCLYAQTASEILQSMSTEQKVGQVMVWGFRGTEFDPAIDEILTKYQPGALIYFRHNIKGQRQIARLNGELIKAARKKLKVPLFLMIDQEGGVVTRVRLNTPVPSALALGKSGNSDDVEKFGKVTGDLLRGLGFNVNLAPVMDLSNPLDRTFIGNRSFGDDPDKVAELSLAFSKGMSKVGVAPTAKHFPGHGGVINDSHKTTPQKLVTTEELDKSDLVPFQKFIDSAFPRAIMSAHLALPKVDPLGLPATYSPVLLRDKLRVEMGFQGVVITDDLEMSGASGAGDAGERAVRAFLAGNDMIMFAGSLANQRRAFTGMLVALGSGRISKERLDESVKRILEMKLQMKIAEGKVDIRQADEAVRRLEAMSKEVMRRNFNIALEEKANPWPTVTADTKTVVFSSSPGFSYRFRKNFIGRTRHFTLTPRTLDSVAEELAQEDLKFAIFYASGTKTARWLSSLTPQLKSKLIVVNATYSGEIEDQNSFLAVLNLNSHSQDSGAWLAEELSKPHEEIRTPAADPAAEQPEN